MLGMSSKVLVLLLVGAVAGGRHPEAPEPTGRSTAAVNTAEFSSDFWYNEARAAIEKRFQRQRDPDQNVARNLVMFLGDGMSIPTLAAARTFKGQNAGKTGEEEELFFESFPGVGLSKTYCVNQQIPDSACTATAYLGGVKNNYGTIGVTAAVSRRDCEASLIEANRLQSIAEWALEAGKDVGIVTTTRVTHASPSGTYAKTANRGWENDAEVIADNQDPEKCIDIAQQLVKMHPGDKFKVILGGGRRNFIPNTTRDEEGTRGRRTDDRNLIEEWQQNKVDRNLSYAYVWNREELRNISASPPEYLLGLFEGNHLQYNLEGDPILEPTLEELTEVAIRILSRNEKGFFLFVEGGRIDHAHHDNYVHLALDETLEFDKAVEKATGLLPEDDSLIVVTADHAHVMTFNGYSARGSSIVGLSDQPDEDRMPYMTISYTNGPGARKQVNGIRDDIREDSDFGELRWRAHVEAPLDSETHGGDDVAVFARGPHYRMFAGLYEQSQIPHLMAYAGCIGPGLYAPGCYADNADSEETTDNTDGDENDDNADVDENDDNADGDENDDNADGDENNNNADGDENDDNADGDENDDNADGDENNNNADGDENNNNADGDENENNAEGDENDDNSDNSDNSDNTDNVDDSGNANHPGGASSIHLTALLLVFATVINLISF